MPAETFNAWLSLYLMTGVCALICAIAAAAQTSFELWRGDWRPEVASTRAKLLLVPRLWLRWQIHYFKGTPAILGLSIAYAWWLGFDLLIDV